MQKKILFISSWYPSKVEPTNGNFVQRHAEAVALKNDVEVLHAVGCAMQKKQYEIVGNVVDTQLFSVGNNKSEPFTFLHISNLVPLKNADKIIKVAARLRAIHQDFRLCIGGDGDVEVLKTLVAQLDATVYIEVFDALTLAEVADKMKSSHCFILFSNYENLPCVLLESIATGTPVIATRVGGVSEIVNERNGVLIFNNEEELLAVMKKMLEREYAFSSPEALHKEIEEKYSRRVISEMLDEVYQKVLNR